MVVGSCGRFALIFWKNPYTKVTTCLLVHPTTTTKQKDTMVSDEPASSKAFNRSIITIKIDYLGDGVQGACLLTKSI